MSEQQASDEAENSTGDIQEEPADLTYFVYGGGIAAGLGLFLTPVLPAPVVAYCVVRIREEKPVSAMLILAIYVATIFFWTLAFIVRG